MGSFDFLLGAQPIQTPNPLTLATQGLTLGNLANQNQLGQLQVQKMQDLIKLYGDPQAAAMMQSMLSPQGGGAQIDPNFFAGHPAAPEFLQSMLGLEKEQAGVNASRAQAAADTEKTQNMGLASLGSIAANFIRSPSQDGFESMLRQIQHNAALGRPPETYTQIPDPSQATPQQVFQWAGTLANMSTSPKDQADIAKIPFDQWAKTAEEKRLWFTMNKPEVKISELTGQPVSVSPYGNKPPQMPPPPGASAPGQPATDAEMGMQTAPLTPQQSAAQSVANQGSSAQPPQVALTATQKVLADSAKPELEQYIAKAGPAAQMKSMLEDLRNTEAQGIYSGGIQGTDFYRKMDNLLAAFGVDNNKIANLDKLANTQGYSAEAQNLIATAVSQFAGARVAQKELGFFEKAKPDLMMTPEGREQVYQKLWGISDRIQQQSQQAGQYFSQNGQLTGFQPKFTVNQMPNPIVPGLPDPATRKGWTAKAPDGTMYQSNGVTWGRISGGNPLADVPK